ncbi:fibronectin-like [Haliotis rufescens]|uniref:fibronectin-like n=1 Tax=Haliotis rufescens TaxID=6454 RepID=UPI00201E8E0C|nr:fibronectin-like [Haliotis rufescens]
MVDDLSPTSVGVSVDSTTTMTASWESPSNAVVTGYEVTVTPGDINQIPVGNVTRTTPITGLTPGRQYYVSVKTKITYLQGRDEETTARFAQPKVTTPDTVDELGDKTNLTAPNIIIDFLKADGDVQYYRVQLQGITDVNYLQTTFVTPPATNKTFNGVVPNFQYNLTITTHSNQQQSTPYARTIRVRASQAGTVNYFKTLALTSRSVSVSWKRPVKTNGDLFEYRLEVSNRTCKQLIVFNCTECKRNTSMEASGNCGHTTVVHLSESDINDSTHVVNYTITGLLPDTTYVVKVAAYNKDGRGIESSLSETTDEEAASEPTAFTANNKTSDTITLTWAPPEPRPGRTHYNIRVYEKIENTPDYNYIDTKNITGYRHNMYSVNNLSSAWEYKFFIQAFTLKGGSGNVSSDVVMTEESISSFDQTILSVRPGGGSVGTNVIPLEICAECLHNAVNGNIVKSGLLVCKVGDCQIRNKIHDARGDSYDRLPNWHSARGSGFTSLYRATADDWMSGKERDDIVLYTVGGETCEIADQTRFCNGPLLTENSYSACANSYDVGAVVGGVVGVIVFAVIVFVAVVVYVKVKRKSRSKKNQDSINLGPTQKFDDTYDEVGDGQRMHAITESSSNDGGYVNQASGLSLDGFDSTYEQLATYQNAEIHDYGQINVKTRNKGAKNKR